MQHVSVKDKEKQIREEPGSISVGNMPHGGALLWGSGLAAMTVGLICCASLMAGTQRAVSEAEVRLDSDKLLGELGGGRGGLCAAVVGHSPGNLRKKTRFSRGCGRISQHEKICLIGVM